MSNAMNVKLLAMNLRLEAVPSIYSSARTELD